MKDHYREVVSMTYKSVGNYLKRPSNLASLSSYIETHGLPIDEKTGHIEYKGYWWDIITFNSANITLRISNVLAGLRKREVPEGTHITALSKWFPESSVRSSEFAKLRGGALAIDGALEKGFRTQLYMRMRRVI